MGTPDRTADRVGAEVRRLVGRGDLDLPWPGHGATAARWAALRALGRDDLCVARLAEGHADALAILAEAGRRPEAGAVYGVWASRSGGDLQLARAGSGYELSGTMRFCSGATLIDRALVAAGDRLLDVDLAAYGVRPVDGSWPAMGMDASVSLDVTFDAVAVPAGAAVGPPGFYTGRCGFALGGAGVAAVWLGGAEGLLAAALSAARPDPHRRALVGAVHASLAAAGALLDVAADAVDADPAGDHAVLAATCRAAVERGARDCIDGVPRITGPGPLARDRDLARRLADLQMYIRQHHGEADLAALGEAVWR
jgi:alkylation response protein AidB-like acyl-CoA dehydrogenase